MNEILNTRCMRGGRGAVRKLVNFHLEWDSVAKFSLNGR